MLYGPVVYLVIKVLYTILEVGSILVKMFFTWIVWMLDTDQFTPDITTFFDILASQLSYESSFATSEVWFTQITNGLMFGGMGLVVLLLIFNLLKHGYSNIVECKDTIPQLFVRAICSLLGVFTLTNLMMEIMSFFREYIYDSSWNYIASAITPNAPKSDLISASQGMSMVGGSLVDNWGKEIETFAESIANLSFGGWADYAKYLSRMFLSLLTIVLTVVIGSQLLKLAFELIKRYVTTVWLIMISPLVASSFTTSTTEIIAKAYANMFIGQLILLLITHIMLKTAIMMWYGTTIADLRQSLLLMAWIAIGNKLEQYMKTLKMDAPMAGGALFDAVAVGATGTFMGLSRASRAAGGVATNIGASTGNVSMVRAGQTLQGRANDSASALSAISNTPFANKGGRSFTEAEYNAMNDCFSRGDRPARETLTRYLDSMNPDEKQRALTRLLNDNYGQAMNGPKGFMGNNGQPPTYRNLNYANGNITGEALIATGSESTPYQSVGFCVGESVKGGIGIDAEGHPNARISFNNDEQLQNRHPGESFTTPYDPSGKKSMEEIRTGIDVGRIVEGSGEEIATGTEIKSVFRSDGGADLYKDENGQAVHFASTNAFGRTTYRGDMESLYGALERAGNPQEQAAALNAQFRDLGLQQVDSYEYAPDGKSILVTGRTDDDKPKTYKFHSGLTNDPDVAGAPVISTPLMGDFKIEKIKTAGGRKTGGGKADSGSVTESSVSGVTTVTGSATESSASGSSAALGSDTATSEQTSHSFHGSAKSSSSTDADSAAKSTTTTTTASSSTSSSETHTQRTERVEHTYQGKKGNSGDSPRHKEKQSDKKRIKPEQAKKPQDDVQGYDWNSSSSPKFNGKK